MNLNKFKGMITFYNKVIKKCFVNITKIFLNHGLQREKKIGWKKYKMT